MYATALGRGDGTRMEGGREGGRKRGTQEEQDWGL